MTTDEIRKEINVRIDRETQYVLVLSNCPNKEGFKVIQSAIKDNNKTLKLLGSYLADQGDSWEIYYKDNYWNK